MRRKPPHDSLLQQRLKQKMSDLGISANALEKQAGLKRSAVQNILQGRSKKPSAQILHAITKILNCNITDLISSSSAHMLEMPLANKDMSNNAVAIPINMSMYAEAVQIANELFKELALQPPAEKALEYIDEIYQYSVRSEKHHIDKNFAQWLLQKSFSSSCV